MQNADQPSLLPPRREMARAFAARDAGYDGVFFVAVRTTGIFCRPSCPSRPNPENIEFLPAVRDCLLAGYRPCKRCHPEQVHGAPPPWAAALMARVEASPDARLTTADLRDAGVSPERARRWFLASFGMSFAAWCRAHRLAAAFTRIRRGEKPDDAGYAAGFESPSGFRDAFRRTFGEAPGGVRAGGDRVVTATVESPIGPLAVAAKDSGVCLLEYADPTSPERGLDAMRRRFGCAVVPGSHPLLDGLREQLAAYFAGRRKDFDLPLAPSGTPFQLRVWQELRRIPYGATLAYDELAKRIGNPTAQRAVARANGANPISILIPCHRVIGKDGTLTGYGGGLWRKRLLLELERTGRLPGAS